MVLSLQACVYVPVYVFHTHRYVGVHYMCALCVCVCVCVFHTQRYVGVHYMCAFVCVCACAYARVCFIHTGM